jgi:hypothetical protein
MSAQPRWEDSRPTQRPVGVPERGPRTEADRNPARILVGIALASVAAGAINATAAATIGRGSAQNVAFFAVVALAQVVWGAVALARAPRWWLALGALGNAVVVATWVVSRTVGLPFGAFAHVTLPIRFPDALSTVLEALIVVGAAALSVRGGALARSASRVRAFALAAALVVGLLGLGGVLSQAGAFHSSGGSGGGGGQINPSAPAGGSGYGY